MLEKQTAEQKFMETLKQSFEEMQKEEYAKKVEELTQKWRDTREKLFLAEDKYNEAGKEMTPQDIADGKLDVYIQSVRSLLAKLFKLETQIEVYKELAGGVSDEKEK